MEPRKLLIIKQKGCPSCEYMESKAIELANKYNTQHTIVDLWKIKESIRPGYTPYFFLLNSEGDKIAEWGGGPEKIDGLETMIKENI